MDTNLFVLRMGILNMIDAATVPDKMTWTEAKDYLEVLIADLKVRIESLSEENEQTNITEDEG